MGKIRSEPPEPLNDDVPADVGSLIDRCLAKAPEERPATFDEVLDELSRLAAEVPKLSLGAAPRRRNTNLVDATTTFVGRDTEIGEISDFLTAGRAALVTLLGPGGIGKTRISRELCRRLSDEFPGGCWFADLSEVWDRDGIAETVARVLSVPLGGEMDPVEVIGNVLSLRPPLLVVLDNFEQLLDHSEATIGAWVRAAPQVRFVVTSRARLALPDEATYELAPLPVDEEGDAVRLFLARAREADPNFELRPGERASVSEIAMGLDGMPLAIELAAARVRIMRPEKIAANLGRKFQLLRSARRDLSDRQKTLRGAISWSFDLLSVWEREAFLQACCFRDGFDLEAIEHVVDLSGFPDAPDPVRAMEELRDKSLLTAEDEGGRVRVGMFRAIREYGETLMVDRPEDFDPVRGRHAGYFADFAERWNAEIPGFRDQEAMDRIYRELGNLDAARERAAEAGDGDLLVRLSLSVAKTLEVRGSPARLVALLKETLEAMNDRKSAAAGRILSHLSVAQRLAGDWEDAVTSGEQAVGILGPAGDDEGLSNALVEEGEILRNRGRLDDAKAAFEEGMKVGERCGNRRAIALGTGGIGMVLGQQGDFDSAFQCFWEAEGIARTAGDRQTAALHSGNLGVVYESRGEADAALACHRKAEDISRKLGNRIRVAVALGSQGNVHSQAGRFDEALRCYLEAEEIARELGSKPRIAMIVGNRGGMHAMQGDTDSALACYEEAESIARELGDLRRVAVSLGQKARMLQSLDDIPGALRCFEEAEEISRGIGDLFVAARNICDRGTLLHSRGEYEAAQAPLEEGIRMYDEMSANQSVWYFAFKAALALNTRELGDEEAAGKLVTECLELADRLGIDGNHPDVPLREAFENLRATPGA
jgi:predicted ATPase